MSNSKKKLLMLVVLIIGCVLTSLLGRLSREKTVVLQPASSNINAQEANKSIPSKPIKGKLIKVYVSGAVLLPGIYELPHEARAHAAIKAAGGMLDIADQDKVNLAKLLKDGMQVNVPYQKGKRVKVAGTDVELKAQRMEFSNKVEKTPKKQLAFPINLNTATQEELEAVPGIGPAMAVRIIARRSISRFQNVDDLISVQGIGKAKLEKLRPYVCVR